MSAAAQIALILVLGIITMMLIAAISGRPLRVSRREIVFPPPQLKLQPKNRTKKVL